MSEHQIWIEGYPKQGGNAKAVLWAKVESENFQMACLKLIHQDEMFSKHFHRQKRTLMGCRIFSSGAKARRRFG